MVPRLHPSHQPKRRLDRFSRFRVDPKYYAVQCTVSGEENPQNVPSSRDFVTPPEEDQTTAIGNMYKTFGKDRACGSGDMLTDRQTDAHIYVIRAQYNASPPLLRA